MTKIEGDTNKHKDVSYSWTEKIKIVKMTILLKAIYWFNAILSKIPMTFFTELKQIIVIFVWKHKKLQIVKAVLKERTKLEISHSLIS